MKLKDRFSDKEEELYEQLLPYNEAIDFINDNFKEFDDDIKWRFRKIYRREKVAPGHKRYTGLPYNFLYEEEDGQMVWIPAKSLLEGDGDDKYVLAEYLRRHDLLDVPAFSAVKRYAKNIKVMTRMINQAKLRSFRVAP